MAKVDCDEMSGVNGFETNKKAEYDEIWWEIGRWI